jgi:putative CocE/NonD family hydrolase
VDLWRQVIDQPIDDESWRKLDLRDRLQRIQAPVLHLSGWYDNALSQVLKAHEGLSVAADGRAPVPQALVVGPWDHQTIFFSLLGGSLRTELGALASIELLPLVLNWFRRWMGEAEAEPGARSSDLPGALLYVMEAQTWLEVDSFPPPGAWEESWYLDSDGHANTAAGDGALVLVPPQVEGADRFVYDPTDPVPTCGGALWPFQAQGLQPGPLDQREVEERPDVLVYTSAPLEEDRLIAGVLRVELWAATSAVDTDFTAKAVDVAPDGTARVVQDGILRCRLATGGDHLLEPGCRYRWTIEVGATTHCLRAGHRLRLEISSSNFPKFDRNLNTAAPIHTGDAGVACDQIIFHGGMTPSRLLLPLVPTTLMTTHRWKS